MQLSQNFRSCGGNLQVASGLVSFAGFISGVIAGWGIAACTGNEHSHDKQNDKHNGGEWEEVGLFKANHQ